MPLLRSGRSTAGEEHDGFELFAELHGLPELLMVEGGAHASGKTERSGGEVAGLPHRARVDVDAGRTGVLRAFLVGNENDRHGSLFDVFKLIGGRNLADIFLSGLLEGVRRGIPAPGAVGAQNVGRNRTEVERRRRRPAAVFRREAGAGPEESREFGVVKRRVRALAVGAAGLERLFEGERAERLRGGKLNLSSLADLVSTRKVNHCQPL